MRSARLSCRVSSRVYAPARSSVCTSRLVRLVWLRLYIEITHVICLYVCNGLVTVPQKARDLRATFYLYVRDSLGGVRKRLHTLSPNYEGSMEGRAGRGAYMSNHTARARDVMLLLALPILGGSGDSAPTRTDALLAYSCDFKTSTSPLLLYY